MSEFNMIRFGEDSIHLNYNMFNATGDDLERFMTYLIEEETWEEGLNYFFHNFDPRFPQPPHSLSFVINPHPTKRQPGNAFVTFSGHETDWSDYEDEIKNVYFPTLRNKFLSEELGVRDILEGDGTNRAIVLMCFEVARRVDMDRDSYPVTRKETIKAINEVMRTAEEEEEEYETKVDLLIKMFRSGGRRNNYSGRKEAYNEIMGYSTYQSSSDSDELVSGIENFSLT